MQAPSVAAGIARVLDSPIEQRLQNGLIASYLVALDGTQALGNELRSRAARALALLITVNNTQVTLAFDWRRSLSSLPGGGYAQELLYKAWYAVNAMQRITSSSDPTGAFLRERRYHVQHLEAQEHRSRSYEAMNALREIYGNTLGWYSVFDDSTTPECREAHGKNFDVTRPPAIGYPGMVHGKCRCTAGPPHRGAEMLA